MFSFLQKSPEQLERDQLKAKIAAAQPEEQYRRPTPLGDAQFPEHNFITFEVTQDNHPIKLHTYRYPQPNVSTSPRSIVVLFHGLNGHLGNYAHIAKALSEETGSAVVGFDNRGFGRSEGVRGLIESQQQHFADCNKFLDVVREHYYQLYKQEIPLFLLGQSMGGMTCFNLALGYQPWLKGTVLIAPAIKDSGDQLVLKGLAKFLGTITPRWGLVPQGHGRSSKNPLVSEQSLQDPYIYQGKVIPSTIKVLLDLMASSSSRFTDYRCPFLIVQGAIDKMVDPYLAKELMQLSPALDKTLIWKDNMWHNVILEEEFEYILPQIVEWIRERI